MTDNDMLLKLMTEFDEGDARRIQHFTKVYTYAHHIGVMEKINDETQKILDAAAILHDIGIIPTEKKYGYNNGKLQEQEGPGPAREMLKAEGGFTAEEIDRICYLIGHHHTYDAVDGIDYRILIEADFLVNAFEDGMDKETIIRVRKNIFRTQSGIHLLNIMYGLEN